MKLTGKAFTSMIKRGILLIFLLITIFVSVEVISALSLEKRREEERNDIARNTSPLSEATIIDLCEKLSLQKDDKRCQTGAVVYAAEFFNDIKKFVRTLPKEHSTNLFIDQVLGKYLWLCDPSDRSAGGTQQYACLYDLQGDHVSIIRILYNKDGTVNIIMASKGGSY